MRTPPSRQDAIIVDVDGTLCDVRAVRRFVEPPPGAVGFKKDFHRFHKGSRHCPAHPAVARLVREARSRGIAIVVVTGREARWRELTMDWLDHEEVPWQVLFTRGPGDYRPDSIVKAEILSAVQEEYVPILAVDDRLDIAEVWMKKGIPTALVTDEGSIQRPLVPTGVEISDRLTFVLEADR